MFLFCPFSASALWESFAVGLQLFSESSNPDLVVFCNTIGYRSILRWTFEDFWTICDFTVSTKDCNALVDVLDLCGNLLLVFSTFELPAIVIASQLHIRHLIRELQLVYLNLLDLMFGTITSLVTILSASSFIT